MRSLRYFPTGVAVHVTQRGNFQQDVFCDDRDRNFFLDLLDHYAWEYRTQVLGYCLMPNHVHLILIPQEPDAIPCLMQILTSSYARVHNARLDRTGHLWQARYFAAVMDERHLRIALAYVDLNPVRAGIVTSAEQYPWSSALAHLGLARYPHFLMAEEFEARFSSDDWHAILAHGVHDQDQAQLRRATRIGRPLASELFITSLEEKSGIQLRARPAGRPRSTEPPQKLVSKVV